MYSTRQRMEEYNYWGDSRVKVIKNKGFEVDEKRMVARVHLYGIQETVEIHCEYEVCSQCRGKGSHVNPAIDAGGISMHDMEPDFRENYFSGAYDITCTECNGKRVVPELHPMGEKEKEYYEMYLSEREEERNYEAEVRAERRMGC